MANISTAEGTVTMRGPLKSVDAFLHFVERMSKWCYEIRIDDDASVIDELDDQLQSYDPIKNNPIIEINVNFYGVGRWYFSNNVRHLIKWLNDDRFNTTSKTFNEDWTIEDEQCFFEMNQNPIELTFEYIDVEEGVSFLIEEKATLTWSSGNILEPLFSEQTLKDHEFNAENIRKTLGNDDVFDYRLESIRRIEQYNGDMWSEYINKYVSSDIDTTDLNDKSSPRHNRFINNLTKNLKEITREKRAIWYSLDDWFNDDCVKEAITESLKVKTK